MQLRPIEVNFREVPSPPRVLWAAACLLGVVALMLFASAWSEQRELDRLRAELSKSLSQPAATPLIAAAPQPLYEQSARRMLAERSADWPTALRALEQVGVEGVQILAFEVSAPQQRIRVEVRFADMKSLLDYVRELDRGEQQARWEIEQASQGRTGEPATASIVGRLGAIHSR